MDLLLPPQRLASRVLIALTSMCVPCEALSVVASLSVVFATCDDQHARPRARCFVPPGTWHGAGAGERGARLVAGKTVAGMRLYPQRNCQILQYW
jgi:hypothetical protein